MNNIKSIRDKNNSMVIRRLQQIVYFTLVVILAAIIFSYVLKHPVETIYLLVLDGALMCALLPLINRNKIILVKQLYLWSNLLVISYFFWVKGGLLSSSVILIYPVFLMVSALIASSRTFLIVYFFIVSLLVYVSVDTIKNNNNAIVSEFGYWEMCVVLIFLSASGYTAWRFNSDMKYALKKLKAEVLNVNTSRNEIERLIHFDPLTGLSSRFNCIEKYKLFTNEINQNKNQISFLFLDIDNFKSINDYYNHSTGDEVLKKIASRLLCLIQGNDIVCRLSGDEFLLMLIRPKNYDMKHLSHGILRNVSKPAKIFDNNIEITASLGIASCDGKQVESFEYLLKKADLAMYRAKELGKNKSSFYDEELSFQSSRKLRIIKELKLALYNNDLELFLQPKINIGTGKIESAEALIRWVRNNPENISPAEFIPLIESTELICNLGEWVISRACVLCKELHENGFEDISISVNISAAQFVRGGLENIINRELKSSQLDAQYLELELTEHILFQDNKDMIDELSRIKDLGVTLSIDDFGTGYSNLGYLTKFKVDTLKIDRSFITDIHKSSENFAIVDAIIRMARALGLKIVAEGVETNQEWDVLKQLGCDQGQGFLWSKPLTSNGFLKHISASV